jgi:hypothetical protein
VIRLSSILNRGDAINRLAAAIGEAEASNGEGAALTGDMAACTMAPLRRAGTHERR